jgi:hypothetical protein
VALGAAREGELSGRNEGNGHRLATLGLDRFAVEKERDGVLEIRAARHAPLYHPGPRSLALARTL